MQKENKITGICIFVAVFDVIPSVEHIQLNVTCEDFYLTMILAACAFG